MPTIRDVAKLAGVAPITVSRVINDSGYTGLETRQRVQEAIQSLGYVPNSLAQSFRWKHTGLLALVITDVTNPFWTTVARGVEDAASDAGLNVILCNTDESDAKQERYVHALLRKQIDGLLLVPTSRGLKALQFAASQHVPVVVLDRRLPGADVDIVRCDSQLGARLVVQHLLSLGHRQIAFLSGPADIPTAEDRLAGYRQALRFAGLGPESELVYFGYFTVESGQIMAEQALSNRPRPTALFAGNNFIAIGALKYLQFIGIKIPGELSVVGFDDLPLHLVIDPFLTVVSQPAYEMGRMAAKLLIDRLQNSQPGASREIVLPSTVVLRRSSGPAPEVT